jgi:tetratricopeptide (TPR) repeat protein
MNVSVRALTSMGAALLVTAPLAAQTPAPAGSQACTVDQSAPGQLAVVSLSLTKAAVPGAKPEDRAKNAREAVKRLTEKPEQYSKNEAERQFALARALMLSAEALPGPVFTAKRGDVGFTSNKEQPVDLLAAADSAFTAVERARPECAATIAQYRATQPWAKLANSAVTALNTQKIDSAEVYAKQALVVNRSNPYPYVVLANVARTRNNNALVLENSRKVIATAGTDTTYNDIRQRAYIDVGYYLSEQAKAAPEAQKAALNAEAAKALRAYLAEAPNGPDAPAVQGQLALLLSASGDSAAVASTYPPMLANPAGFSDIALAQAGVTAEKAKRTADAVKLYEASLQKNPYFRDVLYNLTSAYYDAKQYDAMAPTLAKLLAIDPNNPDNFLLKAYYHQGKMNALKAGAAKKLHTDSLVVWNTRSKTAPVAVRVTGFQRGEAKSTLTGKVENRGAAAKPYALTIEFLDKDGKVVATQRADVGSVAPKQSKEFTVTADGPGVVAYRYQPLS